MPRSSSITRGTHQLDAHGKVLGRFASQIALLLRGKNKPTFVPNVDAGDRVVVKNLKALTFTGKKMDQKVYRHHSMYPGGLKTVRLKEIWGKNPQWVLRKAVERMLPNNKLRGAMLKRLIIE